MITRYRLGLIVYDIVAVKIFDRYRNIDEDTGVDDSCCERRPVSAGDAMNA